jgi:four helix bundle protein
LRVNSFAFYNFGSSKCLRSCKRPKQNGFIHKLCIAQECDESMYWLELLKVRDYLPEDEFNQYMNR